jgi:hypothetical protein
MRAWAKSGILPVQGDVSVVVRDTEREVSATFFIYAL